MRVLSGPGAAAALADAHLLLLPDEEAARAVPALVRARHPGVEQRPDGQDGGTAEEGVALRVDAQTQLHGPLLLDGAVAQSLGVPAGPVVAWVLACPREREGPPLPGTSDRDGYSRAFAEGLPAGAERRAVDLALALARRLGGAVRVSTSGVLLEPDAQARVGRMLLSPSWLAPEEALSAASGAVPGAELAVEGQVWQGLRPEAVEALEAGESGDGLDPREREQLHLAADRSDAVAAAGAVLDGYALVVPLGEGVVEVRVDRTDGAHEALPEALTHQPWARGAVRYHLTWWPADEREAESERPSRRFRAERREAVSVLDALTAALGAAVGGVVLDAEGFPLA